MFFFWTQWATATTSRRVHLPITKSMRRQINNFNICMIVVLAKWCHLVNSCNWRFWQFGALLKIRAFIKWSTSADAIYFLAHSVDDYAWQQRVYTRLVVHNCVQRQAVTRRNKEWRCVDVWPLQVYTVCTVGACRPTPCTKDSRFAEVDKKKLRLTLTLLYIDSAYTV